MGALVYVMRLSLLKPLPDDYRHRARQTGRLTMKRMRASFDGTVPFLLDLCRALYGSRG